MKKIFILLSLILSASLYAQQSVIQEGQTPAQVRTAVNNKFDAHSDSLAWMADSLADHNTRIIAAAQSGGGGSSVVTDLTGTANRVLYVNSSGDVSELALGSSGTYLQSNGAILAPSWETPAGAGDLVSTNNLSDLDDAPTALGNLGLTATASEINTPLDGASVTLTEFQELETIGATTISANQWAALGAIPETVTGTEIGYVDGVTSAIQTQLDGKLDATNLSPAASDIWFTGDTVIGSGYQIDTSLMNTSYVFVIADNYYGSDTLVVRALSILCPGSTAPDVTFDIMWSTTATTASAVHLNTTPINVTSTGRTTDLVFDNVYIPPGYTAIGMFTDVTTKPDQSIISTLFVSRLNRAY